MCTVFNTSKPSTSKREINVEVIVEVSYFWMTTEKTCSFWRTALDAAWNQNSRLRFTYFSGSIHCRDTRGQNYPTFHGVAPVETSRIRKRFKVCNSRDYYSLWFLLCLGPFPGVCRWNPVLDFWNKVILLFVFLHWSKTKWGEGLCHIY